MSDGSYKIQIEVVGADKAARDLENVGKAGLRAGSDLERAGAKTSSIAQQFEQMAAVAGRASGSLAGSFDRLASFTGYLSGISGVAGSVSSAIGNMGTRTTQTMTQVTASTAKAAASFDALKKSMTFDTAASLGRLEADAKAAASRVGASSGVLFRADGTRIDASAPPARSAKVQAAMDAAAAAQAAAAASQAAQGIGSVGRAAADAAGKVSGLNASLGGGPGGGGGGLTGGFNGASIAARAFGTLLATVTATTVAGVLVNMGRLSDQLRRSRSELEQFGRLGTNSPQVVQGVEASARAVGAQISDVGPALLTLQDNYDKLGYTYNQTGRAARENAQFIDLFTKSLATGGATAEGVRKALDLIAKDSETGYLSTGTLKTLMSENRTTAEAMAAATGRSMGEFKLAVERGQVSLRTLMDQMVMFRNTVEADFEAWKQNGRDVEQSYRDIGVSISVIGEKLANMSGLRQGLSATADYLSAPERSLTTTEWAAQDNAMVEAQRQAMRDSGTAATEATQIVGTNLVRAWESVIAAIRNGTTVAEEFKRINVEAAGSIAGAAIARAYNYGPGSFGASPERGAGNAIPLYDTAGFAQSPEANGAMKSDTLGAVRNYVGQTVKVFGDDGVERVVNVMYAGNEITRAAQDAQARSMGRLNDGQLVNTQTNRNGFQNVVSAVGGLGNELSGALSSLAARGFGGTGDPYSTTGSSGGAFGLNEGFTYAAADRDPARERELMLRGEQLYGAGNYELIWTGGRIGRQGSRFRFNQEIRPTVGYEANADLYNQQRIQSQVQALVSQYQYGMLSRTQLETALRTMTVATQPADRLLQQFGGQFAQPSMTAANLDLNAPYFKQLFEAADKLSGAADSLNSASSHISAIGASDLYGVGTPVAPTKLGDYWGGFRTNDPGSPTAQPVQVVVNVNGVTDFDSFQQSVAQVQDAMALALTTRVA